MNFRKELVNHVRKEIGPLASPDKIQFAPGLPKTRSGKIMRRILRKIAEDEFSALGDTSTLADPAVVDDLIANRQNKKGITPSTVKREREGTRQAKPDGEGEGKSASTHPRGPNKITKAPAMLMATPVTSQRSGVCLSTITIHSSAAAI